MLDVLEFCSHNDVYKVVFNVKKGSKGFLTTMFHLWDHFQNENKQIKQFYFVSLKQNSQDLLDYMSKHKVKRINPKPLNEELEDMVKNNPETLRKIVETYPDLFDETKPSQLDMLRKAVKNNPELFEQNSIKNQNIDKVLSRKEELLTIPFNFRDPIELESNNESDLMEACQSGHQVFTSISTQSALDIVERLDKFDLKGLTVKKKVKNKP
jgi:hypothetical protein